MKLVCSFENFSAFGVTNTQGFVINLALVVPFIIGCFTLPEKKQILMAQILSVGYALVMMAVLVGILIQSLEEGPLAPSNLFFMILVGIHVLAGILHPQEIKCLLAGVIYFITMPSMYMLLFIYALLNLHVVSWGTREAPKKQTEEEKEAEKKKLEEAARKKELKSKGTFLGTLFGRSNNSLDLNLKNIFSSQVSPKSNISST